MSNILTSVFQAWVSGFHLWDCIGMLWAQDPINREIQDHTPRAALKVRWRCCTFEWSIELKHTSDVNISPEKSKQYLSFILKKNESLLSSLLFLRACYVKTRNHVSYVISNYLSKTVSLDVKCFRTFWGYERDEEMYFFKYFYDVFWWSHFA